MKALGDYVHGKGLSFAIYSAESTETCGGYPASLNHEALDAQTCMILCNLKLCDILSADAALNFTLLASLAPLAP